MPKRHTSALPPPNVEESNRRAKPAEPPPARARTSIASVRLTVLNSNRVVSFRPDRTIVIGRSDVQSGFYPDMDLTLDGGTEAGVSRSHAQIIFVNGNCLVEDLGSSNGTSVNGQRLAPRVPQLLSSRDKLQLGAIQIRVELLDEPPAPVKLIRH